MAESLLFKVKRHDHEFVKPSKPTPHTIKLLSDVDDQPTLRFQIPVIQFYKYDPNMEGKDPVDVIRKALSKTLVFYYPFAGRLRECPRGKLMVDCNDEGVLFIEADADVSLKEFGDALVPPFPCLDELLFDVPGSSEVINTPILLIQVTRLTCGGFIFALRLNHTMSDAAGLVQFMSAIGEISRGMNKPSISPVWQRDLLSARDPPRVTFTHREYEQVLDTKGTIVPLDDMVHRSFFFGPTDNARGKFNPPLPKGYYGNTFVFPVAVTTALKLIENPLGYALELVKKAKAEVTQEYIHSMADLMVIKDRPHITVVRMYLVSDVTHAELRDVDFGWGKAVYGGPAHGGVGVVRGFASFYIPFRNAKGEEGIIIPLCLPTQAMERFVIELDSLLKNNISQPIKSGQKSSLIISSL
ncbi:hypothetical protein TSUD_404760 [Trifolium subterraneum]|uniref:Benzyl alcohol O-benzoyltransferase n=1 Tax=Trifolium subterraneum TaxID=3900 RepID=A0A2Z6PMM5_TRISU|nr:hypothetical protein TSUD_404760 [Trifolium subterraneum]